jgi:CBS domain-containing protein
VIHVKYEEIRSYRDQQIPAVINDHFKLNLLHDKVITKVIDLSVSRIQVRNGPPPCPYSFFVMGSAGRFEQSIWSDQDHGIIYEQQSDEIKDYFLDLGREISVGLQIAGYDYCDGAVMASNPLWCKSLSEWQQQLSRWIQDSTWESIRQLLIFIDGRSMYGEEIYIEDLKHLVYQSIHNGPLLKRVLTNTLYFKKGMGVLGQVLVETHGPHAGLLNIKETALFPYVNAARLLAIKENITATSTLLRLDSIPDRLIKTSTKELYKQQFLKLLNYRLAHCDNTSYESSHYLRVDTLSKMQKNEVKEILKNGLALYRFVKNLVEKVDNHGDE